MPAPSRAELRLGALAVSVRYDVDLRPESGGLVLLGDPVIAVSWLECRRALGGLDPSGDAGHERLARWLQALRRVGDLRDAGALVPRLRAVGLPVDHPLHPGLDWVQHRVLGGALDLGLGSVGLDPDAPDSVVLVPTRALDHCGLHPDRLWPAVAAHLEAMGALAATRAAADRRGQLRPMGGCDAITLLGAASLRRSLAGSAGGMTTAVVPMRTRGWTRLVLIDPLFGVAAAHATAAAERGFLRPLLITADEVALAPEVAGTDPVRAGMIRSHPAVRRS